MIKKTPRIKNPNKPTMQKKIKKNLKLKKTKPTIEYSSSPLPLQINQKKQTKKKKPYPKKQHTKNPKKLPPPKHALHICPRRWDETVHAKWSFLQKHYKSSYQYDISVCVCICIYVYTHTCW